MKELKIIEGWNNHQPDKEKVCELGVCGHRNSFSSQMIDDLLLQQTQLTREETIKECMEVVQKEYEWNLKMEKETESGLANRDYCLTSHAIFQLKESLQKLLNQNNNE